MKFHQKDKKQLHYSLRGQIVGLFIGLLLLTLMIIVTINGIFLEEYYIFRKEAVLKSVFRALESYVPEETQDAPEGENKGNDPQEEEIPEALAKLSTENNLNWVLLDSYGQYLSGWGQRGSLIAARLFGYMYGIEKTDAKVLEHTGQFIIQKTKEPFMGVEYLEMWGILENGNICLIRSPLESIRESAQISNIFYFYVGLGLLSLSSLLIWIVTKRLTRPINELTHISQQMAELDFNTKYSGGNASMEIDVLGENFNRMSQQLEQTILELQKANKQLQKDIEEKTKIDEMRKEFLNNVSHELKTPIALIQGYAEGLQENINDDPENMDFYCEVIIDESAKMNHMVQSLLNLNQLESCQDTLTLEVFCLEEVVAGVLQASEIFIRQQEVTVRFHKPTPPLWVEADEFKIEEVVTNYLTNALHHVDEHRTVEITLKEQGEHVRLSIFNTGKPIPEESLAQIWNKFYKVDKARTREYGGSGIGLSIVKAIMESHGQECGVTNYENGVEFWFECKRVDAPAQ